MIVGFPPKNKDKTELQIVFSSSSVSEVALLMYYINILRVFLFFLYFPWILYFYKTVNINIHDVTFSLSIGADIFILS